MRFANDFENLLVVEGGLNQSKGAKGPDKWMPPNHNFRCNYLKQFDFIVAKYNSLYTPSESRILDRMLSPCSV